MSDSSFGRASYKKNDYVSYRKNGVCQIADITVQSFAGQGKKEYYELISVYDSNMKVFVPIGSELEKGMRDVPSVEEIHKLIEESVLLNDMWVDDCRARAAMFEEIVNSGDKVKLLWMIRRLTQHKNEMESGKKKVKANDSKYLSLAEGLIAGDFAFSLNLPRGGVIPYIKQYEASIELVK